MSISVPDAGQPDDAVDVEEQWSLFSGPLDKIIEPADPSRAGRKIRRMEHIEVVQEDYDMQYDLKSLKFWSPDTAENARVLYDALMKLSRETNTMTTDLRNGAPPLSRETKVELNRIRHDLVELLADHGRLLSEKQHFQVDGTDRTYRPDVFVFFGLMQSMCCLAHDSSYGELLKTTHCSSDTLHTLVESRIVPENLSTRPFAEYRLPDIISSLKWLEARWLTIPYFACMSIYIDLLLARLSVLCIVPQPEHMFGSITDYKKTIGNGYFTHTPRLIEDCCWTFGPIYKKLLLYQRVCRERDTSVQIPNDDRKRIQKESVDNAYDMNNKDLIGLFFKTYMKCGLRPSERQKFLRDYPTKAVSAPAIIEKMRGEDSKKRIMEHLARAPWVIAREKLFDKTTTEILYILLLDSFISNITGLRWMDTFVEFNVQLLKRKDVADYLDRNYPRIIQDFNNFNLLHNKVLYIHNSAAKSYIHWLHIMMKPPFNGRFLSRSLESLTKYTPSMNGLA